MAKKTPRLSVPFLPHELRTIAIKEFMTDFSKAPVAIQPYPRRSFEVGEVVRVGNLHDVIIEEVLLDGMAYQYRGVLTARDGSTTVYRCDWWFNIDKFPVNRAAPRLASPHQQYPASHSSISSLFHLLNSGGIVFNPQYQRGYVWSDADKDSLLDSMFEHLDIGTFLFVRNAGYLHSNDPTSREYHTLDGDLVAVKRSEDYTTAVIDGQQRITTIMHFMLDIRPYRGMYYSDIHPMDRNEFENTSVMFRTIREEQVTDAEIVRMFLQSNRGVSQTPEHLSNVQALYDRMKHTT